MSGFTLVEILVTATIIGLLSTIGVTGFQAITRSGRDAIRRSDLEQIRSALEIYKTENNSYPITSSTCVADLSSSYINSYPADPKPLTARYCYTKLTNLTYILCAHLENGDASDYNCDNNVDTSQDCTLNCNYKVVNP